MNNEDNETKVTETVRTETNPSRDKGTNGDGDEHGRNVADRAVWYIAGAIIALLGLRFLLALLGANTTNVIADVVYSVSRVFVAPFFSLFSYDNFEYGVSRFELYTLIAIIFYAFLAWGITKFLDINRR